MITATEPRAFVFAPRQSKKHQLAFDKLPLLFLQVSPKAATSISQERIASGVFLGVPVPPLTKLLCLLQ